MKKEKMVLLAGVIYLLIFAGSIVLKSSENVILMIFSMAPLVVLAVITYYIRKDHSQEPTSIQEFWSGHDDNHYRF